MRIVRRHWLPGLLGLCAILALGLLAWPAGSARPVSPAPVERYAGPDAQPRKGGPVSGFALRLRSSEAPAEAAPRAEALPVLVGIAGRRAYLRSTASGEVERVSIGQEIDGWRLVAVSARAATLRGAGGDRRVEMFAVESVSPAAGGASATPSPATIPPASPMAQPADGG